VSIDPAWKLDGVNLLPYATGENKSAPHESLYWRFGDQMALRHGDWKLVKARDSDGVQLHKLNDDIGEKANLAASQLEKLKQLTAVWNAWNATLVEPKWDQVNRGKAGKGKKKAK